MGVVENSDKYEKYINCLQSSTICHYCKKVYGYFSMIVENTKVKHKLWYAKNMYFVGEIFIWNHLYFCLKLILGRWKVLCFMTVPL